MKKSTLDSIVKKLNRNYSRLIEHEDHTSEEEMKESLEFFNRFKGSFSSVMYVPHDENHKPMLKFLKKDDIVCDMGAGDLRFALMASQKCKKVYAVEACPTTLSEALRVIGYNLPENLIPICANWDVFPVPRDVTVVTCMVNGAHSIPWKDWSGWDEANTVHGLVNIYHRRLYFGVTYDGGSVWKFEQFECDRKAPREVHGIKCNTCYYIYGPRPPCLMRDGTWPRTITIPLSDELLKRTRTA